MTAITHQKHDAARDILDLIQEYLLEEPAIATKVALFACRRLVSKMTLSELCLWRDNLLSNKHTWGTAG